MRISYFAKAIVYVSAASMLTILSILVHTGMEIPEQGGHMTAGLYTLVTAICCIGFAVYAWRAYVREHREHSADCLFFMLYGLAAMVAGLIVFVGYGGLHSAHTQQWYDASNISRTVAGVMPLPFFVRAFYTAAKSATFRRGMIAVDVIAAGGYIAAVTLGGLFRFVYYAG